MSDEPINFDEEQMQPEPAVTIADAPYVNGTGSMTHAQEQQLASAPPGATAELKIKGTASQFLGRNAASLMGVASRRPVSAEDTRRTKDDRQFIDDLMFRPEASDYQFSVIRYLPSHDASGEPLRNGKIDILPFMPYDSVADEIARKWGGGRYKLVIVDMHSRVIDSVTRAILVDVPTNLYPSTNEPYSNDIQKVLATPRSEEPDGDDEKEKERLWKQEQREREREKRRRMEEMRRQEEELKMAEKEREFERRRRAISGTDDSALESKALLAKIEEQRKEDLRRIEEQRARDEAARAEERRRIEEAQKEDRRMFMEGLSKMSENIARVAEVAAKPKEDAGFKDMIALIMAQQAKSQDSTTAILTALISKEPPQPPQPPDLMPMIAEINKSNSAVVTALMQRPQEDSGKKLLDTATQLANLNKPDKTLENALITKFLDSKEDTGIKEFMAIMELGEKREEKLMTKVQEMTASMQGAEGDTPAVADPEGGGVIKTIVDGLRDIIATAVSNPATQQWLMSRFGSTNPTNQQLEMAAMQIQNMQVPPPQLAYPPQMNSFRAPIPPPINQQQVDQYNAMMNPQPLVTPPQSMPPTIRPPAQNPVSVSPPPAQTPTPAPAQPQSVASELEGAASGLPSNGDPATDEPLTPEQIAVQQMQEAVTATMEEALGEMVNKPQTRTWADHAQNTWPLALRQKIAAPNPIQEKIAAIGEQCHPDVWTKLNQMIEADNAPTNPERGAELSHFINEVHRLTQMNTQKAV